MVTGLQPPLNLSSYNVTGTTASVIWTAPPEGQTPEGYEYSLNSAPPVFVGPSLNVDLTDLDESTNYSIRVRSVSPNADTITEFIEEDFPEVSSDWATLEFSTNAGSPSAPTNVTATSLTASGGTFSWQAGTGGPPVTRYEYSIENSVPVDVGLSLSVDVTGLTRETDYTFKVRSVGEFGISAWTTVSFQTKGAPPAPASLGADQITSSSARLSWYDIPSNNPATGHRYSINYGTPVTIGNVQEQVIAGLNYNTQYVFRVQAFNAYGSSAWVAINVYTEMGVPNKPVEVLLSDTTPTTATVLWTPSTTGPAPTSYRYSLDDGEVFDVGLATSFTFEGFEPGSVHTVRIQARNPSGASPWESLTFTVNPGAPLEPINLVVSQITQTDAMIDWEPAPTGPEVLSYEYSVDFSEVLDSGLVKKVILESLLPGSAHTFRVRSVGEYDTSNWSMVAFSTSPADVVATSGKLQWDVAGTRTYESGLSNGVLYLSDNSGVAWSGLISVDEDLGDEGAEPFYMDGVKYLDAATMGDYSANLRAITYPDEFEQFEGYGSLGVGILADDQISGLFGLSYRTLIGNDIDGDDANYKLHLVYNLTATPDSRPHATVGADATPTEFGWQITGVPVAYPGYRPTAHVIFDSRYIHKFILSSLEDILYGNQDNYARLPTLSEIKDFIDNFVFVQIFDNGDGTWTARGPSTAIQMLDPTTFRINDANAVFIDENTYIITDS